MLARLNHAGRKRPYAKPPIGRASAPAKTAEGVMAHRVFWYGQWPMAVSGKPQSMRNRPLSPDRMFRLCGLEGSSAHEEERTKPGGQSDYLRGGKGLRILNNKRLLMRTRTFGPFGRTCRKGNRDGTIWFMEDSIHRNAPLNFVRSTR